MAQRPDIRLTPDEQTAFLRENRKAALATLDQNGFPHVVAMNFIVRDGVYYMTSYGKAQKDINIRGNHKVGVMFEHDVGDGAGPSGLAASIRLKQLAAAAGRELGVCVIEKGSEVGAHILSGAVFEPRALDELIPDWRTRGAPLKTPASEDRFLYLTKNRALRLPTPPQMHNRGNYIISLGNLCRWLASQAEELGVEIYPGFAGAEVLYAEDGRVRGVATGDMGIGRDGESTERYTPGVELIARETLFAEGARGSL